MVENVKSFFVSEEMLDDPLMLAGVVKSMFEESNDSTIQLVLMGFNSRLGLVPKYLEDKE